MFLLFLCVSNVQRYFLLGCQAFHERPGQLAITNANLYLSVSPVKSLFQKEVEIPFDSVRQVKSSLSQIRLGVKLTAQRAGLPENVDLITGSAFLPAPAYRQEGGASSRLARELGNTHAKLGENRNKQI
jgi:hypothetical protein